MRKTTILLSTLLVAGCSWNALNSKPSIAPVHVAFTDFAKPHPGKYLLHVSGVGFDQNVLVGGLVCTSHEFPLQIAHSFDESVKKSLDNMLEKVEIVPAAMTGTQIKAAKARALIVITADKLSGHLLVSPGFLTKESKAKVQISARVQVIKPKGMLLDEHVSSEDTASHTIGRCLDAHKPVSAAASKALNQLVERIGNAILKSLSPAK